MYSFPQCLSFFSVFALLAIKFSFFWLFALSFLIFLAPLPAVFRVWFEKRGYAMGIAISMWKYGDISYNMVLFLKKVFTGSHYYFMAKDDRWVDGYIERVVELSAYDNNGLKETLFDWSPAFRIVHRILTGIEFD
jgi:hypothetical protein